MTEDSSRGLVAYDILAPSEPLYPKFSKLTQRIRTKPIIPDGFVLIDQDIDSGEWFENEWCGVLVEITKWMAYKEKIEEARTIAESFDGPYVSS